MLASVAAVKAAWKGITQVTLKICGSALLGSAYPVTSNYIWRQTGGWKMKNRRMAVRPDDPQISDAWIGNVLLFLSGAGFVFVIDLLMGVR